MINHVSTIFMFIITGQTATGKTKLALKLAKKHNGELINCDSRQIYQHLNIITGKDIDTKSEFNLFRRLGDFDIGYFSIKFSNYQFSNNLTIKQFNNATKIWLYDIVDPKTPFSSFDWATCARIVIKDIIKRGKTPIIVGGTYLYLKHLLYGFETEKIPPDWTLRKQLNKYTVLKLQKNLIKIAPEIFQKLNQSDVVNPQRLIRKIEIALYNCKRLSVDSRQSAVGSQQSAVNNFKLSDNFIGLKYKNKNDLIKAITKRVNQRIKKWALDEVKLLLTKKYLSIDLGLKTIGYSQLIDYLSKKISLKEAIDIWTIKEIQYAKRQYTFMKKDSNIHWRII